MIGIIDYGMGNLHSVHKALEKVGAQVKFVSTPQEIQTVDKLILPGVGAFRDAIGTLREKHLAEPIHRFVDSGRWFLGICLGLQLLFDTSYEDGQYEGLGIIAGKVVRFDLSHLPNPQDLKIPHMGWNALQMKRPDIPLYQNIPQGTYVYFVHSYHVAPTDASVIATTTCHGIDFVSSVWKNNVLATQFHPEKSQRFGLQMLRNFAAL